MPPATARLHEKANEMHFGMWFPGTHKAMLGSLMPLFLVRIAIGKPAAHWGGRKQVGNFLEEIEIFVASFVLSFVDKVCDKARDKDSMDGGSVT
jgi:hypothetical protein